MPKPKKVEDDNGNATVSIKRSRAKQEDLPGVEVSSRKIQEIEDLADEVVECEDRHKATKHALDDAMENLVASMRRHNKLFYNRPTWGSVTLKEAKVRAKVDKAQRGADNDEEEVVDILADAGVEVQLEEV